MSSQRVSSPRYDSEQDIAISYYNVDEHNKIWICSPLVSDFVLENPYTGDDRFSNLNRENNTFKIPYLKKVGTSLLEKNAVLVACLWLRDHKSYTDKLVTTGHEFYRCLTKDENNNWILIPLYSMMGGIRKRNPVAIYRNQDFKNTIITRNYDIYRHLVDMFFDFKYKGLINHFPILMNGQMKWMIQFPDMPACFL